MTPGLMALLEILDFNIFFGIEPFRVLPGAAQFIDMPQKYFP